MKKSAIILAAIMLLSSFEPVVATEKPTTENKKINWLLENDFVAGRGKTKDLKLEDTITRAEFTRMILVIKGEENLAKDSTSKVDFKDVPNTHWAEKFIVYAKQKGYISGYPDGNFRPEGEITYEEMISILSRIHPNYRKIEAKSTNWAEGFINFAKDNGILDDISIDGSYKSPAIREKTFEMTYNFIKFVENQTKSEKVSKIKEEKDVKRENSTWNGFYPYWLGYGFRPIVEEKPEVKPNPDVKPVPDKHEEPGTPEKENPSEPGTQPETPGEENPTEPGKENPSEPGTEPENPTEPGKENPSDPGTEPESPSEPETPKEFDKTKIDKIEIVSQPSKREYTEGEKLDLSGIKLKLTDTQGIVKEAGLEDFSEYGIATDPANETGLSVNENGTTIKIKLNGVEKVETAPLKVNAKVFDPAHVEKMVVKEQPTNLIYTEGEKLNLSGLEVTLTDNQGLTKDVAFKDFAVNGITTEPENNKQLTESENNTKIKIKRGDKEAITGNISLTLKVISKADFEKENKIKTSIKNSLVEVYKSLGDIKLGIDNLHNKYYLLFTKESNKIEIEKDNLKTSILNTIKNNKIKSYTIGETNRELLDGKNYKSDETILGFIREDILKISGLEGNQDVTDVQILEQLKTTKPNTNIKLVVGDENIELNYEIIFLSQMTEDKVNQIEADFIEHMKETSLAVQKEDKGFQVSYINKEYKVLIKPAYKDKDKVKDMQQLADKCGYDRVLINFFTGENLDTAKSLKNLKSLKIYNKNRYDRISNVVMDSLELQTLLVGKEDFRERTKIYHETFRKPNRGIFADDLAPGTIRLEYFYTDESSRTGSIITRNIYYKIIN